MLKLRSISTWAHVDLAVILYLLSLCRDLVVVDEAYVSKTCHSMICLESLQLQQCDKNYIFNSTGCLNDSVNAAH